MPSENSATLHVRMSVLFCSLDSYHVARMHRKSYFLFAKISNMMFLIFYIMRLCYFISCLNKYNGFRAVGSCVFGMRRRLHRL